MEGGRGKEWRKKGEGMVMGEEMMIGKTDEERRREGTEERNKKGDAERRLGGLKTIMEGQRRHGEKN